MVLFSHFVDPPLTSKWTTWDIALGIKFAPIGCRGLWLTDHIQMEHELCSVILTTASRVTNVRNLLQCKIYSECNPQMLSRRELWSALGKLGKLETLRLCRVLFVQIQPKPPWRPFSAPRSMSSMLRTASSFKDAPSLFQRKAHPLLQQHSKKITNQLFLNFQLYVNLDNVKMSIWIAGGI